MSDTRSTPRWPLVASLLLILLVAAGLRLYRMPELPLGLHYDEAANVILAGEIARGTKAPIFIPSYTGKEVLFFYWAALWMKLLGVTPLALRLGAATVGLATIAATFWAVRELLRGRRDADWMALLAAAFLATSFWHLILSRYGFRAVTQPLMQALTVAALWRGLRKRKRGWLLLAGLFCGLTAYTYLAARAFPIPLTAALLALLITDRGHRRARLGQLVLFAAVAALTLTPLAHYWLTHPGSFTNRTQQVAAASWIEVWTGLRACLKMFFLTGDPYIRFNLPRRPLFDPITATFFLLGIIAIIWQFIRLLRDPRRSHTPIHLASCIFLLTYLPTMLLPSALAAGEITPSNLRTAGLLPFVYVFPALALSNLKSYHLNKPGGGGCAGGFAARTSPIFPYLLRRYLKSLISTLAPPTARRLLVAIVHCSLFIFLLLTTATAYFHDWAPSAALYYAADGDMADIAAYLNQADLTTTTPYVASIHYRHPTLVLLAKDYGMIRWLTGGKTVVFPAQGEALLIFPRSASEDRSWVESVLPEDARVAAPRGPDGAPAFRAYRVGSAADLAPTHPPTADLGHVAHLLGYDVVGEPRAGESAEVAVWWRVLNQPAQQDYGTLVRLADPWGLGWSENRHAFHYPSEQWTPGEVIVDHLTIPIAPGAPPGDYLVRFSFYSASTDQTLPVLEGDRYAGTYVELPVRLARATTPPHPDDLGIRTRLDASTGGLTLLGANLDTTSARPGERLYLTLFWRADETPLPDYAVTLTLGDATLYTGTPVHDTYPTSEWATGEIVADRYDPRLPREMPPGDYPLRLQMGDLAVALDTVTVPAVDRTFDVPPVAHPLTVTLGNQVALLGYDLSAETAMPGDTLSLTLYWRALIEMDESYTVFVHLLAPDGSITGQRDNSPVGGGYPTDLWLAGEVVKDVYEILISADTAPGEYQLKVGMYIAENGVRLPVAGTPDGAIALQTIIKE